MVLSSLRVGYFLYMRGDTLLVVEEFKYFGILFKCDRKREHKIGKRIRSAAEFTGVELVCWGNTSSVFGHSSQVNQCHLWLRALGSD